MSPELVGLLGGSALLVYSIDELSKSVQYLAGSKFRSWINAWSERRFSGILLGIVLALLLSSSGAVTVMMVMLANARLLSIEQIFSVMLGASIGTTFIVHLIAFSIDRYGLLIIALATLISAFSYSEKVSKIARGLFFLGLLFFSMALIVSSGEGLEHNQLFDYIITYFQNRPIVSLLISTTLTAVFRSSAATIAFVMSMMMARHATVYQAIPWVLGANLGSTAMGFFASFKSGVLGKQVALGHLLTRVVGIVLCFPLMKYLGDAAIYMGGDVSRQIANTHTLFNVFVAIIFYPFVPWGVAIVKKFVHETEDHGPFNFQYLDPRTLSAPELALVQAQREILRLSDTVEQMVNRSLALFQRGSQKEVETLKEMDQVVDFLNRGIKLYLTKLSQKEMTPEQVQKEFELLVRTNDLENIGDIIDKNVLELVRKTLKKGYTFSKEGWHEITSFHAKVVECLRVSTAYFASHDRSLLAKLLLLNDEINDLMLDLSEQHVQRLHQGVKETLETTSVHLDLLGNLQRIASLAVNFTRIHGPRVIGEEAAKL